MRSAALVCAREPESCAHVAGIAGDLGDRLAVFPDFTIGLPGTPSAATRWNVDRRSALLIPNVHMRGERNSDATWHSGYLPLLCSLARRLAELGFVPRILNHEGQADAALCESLREATGGTEVITEADPRALKAVFPDFTIGLSGTPSAAVRWGVDRNSALLIANDHMRTDRNPDATWRSGYVPLLCSLARQLAALGFVPRILNHEGHADAALCESLREATGGAEVIAEADPRALKGIIGAAGIVVCSRYHGCVSALAQGVPCLGTSWSHKYAALFDEFGVAEYLLDTCDEAAATAALRRLAADRDRVSEVLLSRRLGARDTHRSDVESGIGDNRREPLAVRLPL